MGDTLIICTMMICFTVFVYGCQQCSRDSSEEIRQDYIYRCLEAGRPAQDCAVIK